MSNTGGCETEIFLDREISDLKVENKVIKTMIGELKKAINEHTDRYENLIKEELKKKSEQNEQIEIIHKKLEKMKKNVHKNKLCCDKFENKLDDQAVEISKKIQETETKFDELLFHAVSEENKKTSFEQSFSSLKFRIDNLENRRFYTKCAQQNPNTFTHNDRQFIDQFSTQPTKIEDKEEKL